MLDTWSVIEEYGWYILLFTVVLLYIYSKVKPSIDDFINRRAEKQYAEKYHKNPDLFVKHVTAQQTYAEKLQEKYNQSLEQYKEKQEEKERIKRLEILQQTDEGGHRLGNGSKSSSEKKSFKPEYNPLMGSGPSSNYRPPKRSCCSGGGCG